MMRVPAVPVVAAGHGDLGRPWRGETREYQAWLRDIWANLIRIELGRGEYGPADSSVSTSRRPTNPKRIGTP